MASIKFSPIELRRHLDETGELLISREGHVQFRDDIVRLLNKLRPKTITGTLTVSSLGVGMTVDVFVDHTSSATFGFESYPAFTAINGVDVEVFALIDIAGTGYATSGTGFAIRISNISKSDYAPSFNLAWSRTGLLAG